MALLGLVNLANMAWGSALYVVAGPACGLRACTRSVFWTCRAFLTSQSRLSVAPCHPICSLTSLQGSRSGALSANAASFALLWAYRSGDANMRSAWVCTRNDVLGNLAVLLAALGVFGTGTGRPDIIVASTMAALALQGAWIVISQSQAELHISAAHDIVKGATSR